MEKHYWRSLAEREDPSELARAAEAEFSENPLHQIELGSSRRGFLKAAGFTPEVNYFDVIWIPNITVNQIVETCQRYAPSYGRRFSSWGAAVYFTDGTWRYKCWGY